MLKNIQKLSLALSLAVAITGFSACSSDDKNDDPDPVAPGTTSYGLRVASGNPLATYFLETPSLSTGTVSTVGNGAETTLSAVTSKGGFYYGFDDAATKLTKYKIENNKQVIVKEIPFTQISWAYYSSFYQWKDSKTLVLFSSNEAIQFEYAILDVENMVITSSGKLNIPAPLKDHYYWAYSAAIVDNKVYVTYTQNKNVTDVPVDTTYLAAIDYPAMNNITVTKDTRFTFPGHYTLNAPSSFVDNGIAYFLTEPTFWATKNNNKPFGVFRVQKGSTETDKSYFYELTDKTKEEALGMYYIGSGKAIVQIYDKTQITTNDDYGTKFIADYYVVDVINKSKTKLNLPKALVGTYIENVLVEGDKVHIAINTQADGWNVYDYTISTGAVAKGLKINGISSLSRLDKLK